MSRLFKRKSSSINESNLQKYLDSNIRDEKIKAIQFLEESKIERAADILVELSQNDPDITVRETAIVALSGFQFNGYVEHLTKIFNSYIERNDFVRARAVWALGKIDSPEIYNVLMRGINDEHVEVKYWSIVGLLYQKKSPVPFRELTELFCSNDNYLIRQAIVWIFGIIGDTTPVKMLTDVLLNDKNYQVRMTATWALKRINDIGSISSLCYALKNELNELTKRELAITIGTILDRSSDLPLENLDSQENFRKEAIQILSIVIQRDTCYYVRRACAESLGKLNDIAAVPVLVNTYASDVNQFVRKEIANALGKLGDIRALPVLKKSLRSHYKIVVFAAKAAIERIEANEGEN